MVSKLISLKSCCSLIKTNLVFERENGVYFTGSLRRPRDTGESFYSSLVQHRRHPQTRDRDIFPPATYPTVKDTEKNSRGPKATRRLLRTYCFLGMLTLNQRNQTTLCITHCEHLGHTTTHPEESAAIPHGKLRTMRACAGCGTSL